MSHSYTDIPAAGSLLQISIASVFTTIPGCTEITWDGYKRAVRNPTNLLSPAVAKKPGMPDFGQVKSKVNFDPNDTTHQLVRDKLAAAAAAATVDSWKVVFADGLTTPAEVEFVGFVSEFGMASNEAETGTWTADLTIEVSDITAWAEGSPIY